MSPSPKQKPKLTFVRERSTARAALDRSIERENQAREAVAAARRPYDQASAQVERAQELARDRQAALHQLDADEAARLGATWPPATPSEQERAKRRNAETALAEAVRTLRIVEANRDRARDIHDAEIVKLAPLAKEVDAAVTGVLVEKAEAALAHLIEARRQAVEAETATRSVAMALAARQDFVAAEKISRALFELPHQHLEVNPYPAPFLDLAQRLRNDPDAAVTP
jgi:hypothetical protein